MSMAKIDKYCYLTSLVAIVTFLSRSQCFEHLCDSRVGVGMFHDLLAFQQYKNTREFGEQLFPSMMVS